MKKMLTILGMVVAPVTLSFFISHSGEYDGPDGEVESQIRATAPHHEPRFQPSYESVSGEIESLLFTLQGSLGAAAIFYTLGYTKGRQRRDDRT